MTPIEQQLTQALEAAVPRLDASAPAGAPAPARESLPRWEIPKDASFGDLANSAAFRLAARQKQPPQKLAERLAELFLAACREQGLGGAVDRVEAKGGYLNV